MNTTNEEKKNTDGKRYLKKFEIVETDAELPIQGQVRDPEDLYVFLKDLENDQVPKVIGIYLDENHLFLAHQVFVGQTSKTFETQAFHHYYNMFLAKRFIVLINHPNGEATPTDDDIKLMKKFQNDAAVLSYQPFFADFIVVGKKSYFSMSTNDGTSCHCGHQEYIPNI